MTLIDKSNDDLSYVYTGLLALTMFGLAVLTIVGNTIVIYALRTDRDLRTVILMFIFFLHIESRETKENSLKTNFIVLRRCKKETLSFFAY